MWRRSVSGRQHWRSFHASSRCRTTKPVIELKDATFYRNYPSDTDDDKSNPLLFKGLNFVLPNGREYSGSDTPLERQYSSVISNSSVARTTFLQILAGQHICLPPAARSYPYLSEAGISPQHGIKYVGFDAERGNSVGGTNVRGAYLSARYESRREETDWSVQNYLTGQTELNALEHEASAVDTEMLEEVTRQLNLTNLLQMPVANLSNGQTRRTRIAKALMARPEVLLLDGPFMGLDPYTLVTLSRVLRDLAARSQPRLVVSLRPEDGIPEWISHLVVVDEHLRVVEQGPKSRIIGSEHSAQVHRVLGFGTHDAQTQSTDHVSVDGFPKHSPALPKGEALVDMRGVKVSYGTKTVLGDWTQTVDSEQQPGLWWSLHRGQRCGIFGANGSGKTTMLSLITSDHPQTYSLPIKLFGRSRLPGPGEQGISLFDIQRRMGHSSPEVHAFFPKQLTVRRTLESAWADAPMSKPILNDQAKSRVNACLRWFADEIMQRADGRGMIHSLENNPDITAQAIKETLNNEDDLNWAKNTRFGELNFSSQRLVLFLRSVVASPDLVILDEAFSGMDEAVRNKALLFLSQGERIQRVENGIAEESVLAKHGAAVMEGLSREQALLVISHAKEDVPGCLREWTCLPEPGEGRKPRIGVLDGPLELNPRGWDEIWGRDM